MKRTLIYALAALLWMIGCKGLQGGAIGAGVGAATGTPQGALTGGAAGFVVGLWNDITDWAVNFWHGLFGGPVVNPPAPSNAIWLWLIVLALIGFGLKMFFHADFRAHVIGFFKTLPRIRK